MKKFKFQGKLNLNKETVVNLNSPAMDKIVGGGTNASWNVTVCTNMSQISPCYSMGTTCLPDSASCNPGSCPQAGC